MPQANAVNQWVNDGSAYLEFTAQPPAGGAAVAFVVNVPAYDGQGNLLPQATIQQALLAAARARYFGQFPNNPNLPPPPGGFTI